MIKATAHSDAVSRRQSVQVSPSKNGMRRRRVLAGSVASFLGAPRAWSQTPTYPARPIQLVVAAPPGGSSDALARMLADAMAATLGQAIIVDNRPGAGGTLAAEMVARSVPDGQTLMMSWIGNVTAPALLPKLSFDINRDLVHITQLVSGANVLVAHPSTGFKTLQALVAAAKAKPGRLTYASSGNGSSGHLAMELLKQRAGISILHIPYRGGAPATTDFLGGQVDMMFINQDAVLPYLRNARMGPLAITSQARNPLFPDLPTVAESGYPDFEATAWAGLSAPRGTPAAVVELVHAAAVKALQGPVRGKQEAVGTQVIGSTPAQYTAFVRSETDKWAHVIRTAGIKAD
jgi:tripartite-type tricarboxylate transporter receptor subunit TctC